MNITRSKDGLRRLFTPDLLLAVAVLIGFVAQLWMALAFKEYLAQEDAGESLRSPFWWAHGKVLNGVTSNVGYYTMVAVAQELFGFSIYLPRLLRVFLHLFSLIAVASLLRQWMGARLAFIPFLVAALSPTWLYFNSIQSIFGIDLQYAPFLILLGMWIPLRKSFTSFASLFFMGALWIWSAMNYPTGLFYLPALGLLLLWRWWKIHEKINFADLLWLGACFGLGVVAPIAAALLYAESPQMLIYDPYVSAGMLRGGGYGFTRRPHVIFEHFSIVLTDLFLHSKSYFFFLPRVEFSNWFDRLGFALVSLGIGVASWQCFRKRPWREALKVPQNALLLWFLFFTLFIFCFPQLVATFPGMRRMCGALVGYYGLVAYVWYMAWKWPPSALAKPLRALFVIGVLAHLTGHSLSLIQNITIAPPLANDAVKPEWFKVKDTIAASLQYWEEATRRGEILRCESLETCRYQEIYPAIQSYRLWNGMPPHEVKAWDPLKKIVRPIELSIWESNEWPRW